MSKREVGISPYTSGCMGLSLVEKYIIIYYNNNIFFLFGTLLNNILASAEVSYSFF